MRVLSKLTKYVTIIIAIGAVFILTACQTSVEEPDYSRRTSFFLYPSHVSPSQIEITLVNKTSNENVELSNSVYIYKFEENNWRELNSKDIHPASKLIKPEGSAAFLISLENFEGELEPGLYKLQTTIRIGEARTPQAKSFMFRIDRPNPNSKPTTPLSFSYGDVMFEKLPIENIPERTPFDPILEEDREFLDRLNYTDPIIGDKEIEYIEGKIPLEKIIKRNEIIFVGTVNNIQNYKVHINDQGRELSVVTFFIKESFTNDYLQGDEIKVLMDSTIGLGPYIKGDSMVTALANSMDALVYARPLSENHGYFENGSYVSYFDIADAFIATEANIFMKIDDETLLYSDVYAFDLRGVKTLDDILGITGVLR